MNRELAKTTTTESLVDSVLEEGSLANNRELLDPAKDFEKLVKQSRGADLFYKPTKPAELQGLGKSRRGYGYSNSDSEKDISFYGEDGMIWSIVQNPTASTLDKLQRQQTMDGLVTYEKLEELEESRSLAYELKNDFDGLFNRQYGEDSRMDRVRRRSGASDRQCTKRTELQFLFPENKSYLRTRKAFQQLGDRQEMTPSEWAEIRNIAGWEDWEGGEIWAKKTLWDKLHNLPKKRQVIIDFADYLTELEEPNIVKMGQVLKQEAEALPSFTGISVYKAWRFKRKRPTNTDEVMSYKGIESAEKLALDESASSVNNHVEKIGALLTMARHIVEEGFGRAEFDNSVPEYFTRGWNFKKKKQYEHWREDKPSWAQVPNDAPKSSPITLFNGSNMSGKSFNLEQILYMNLCAQAFGYMPAEAGNFHNYDAFLYIDRSNTDSDNDLSAFGKEVTQWNEVFATAQEASNPLILADESYSTTSPEDQFRLGVASLAHLMEQGARVYWANHNERLNKLVGNWSDANLYHFKTGIGKNGDIDFLYTMQKGLEDSHSIEVARKLGLKTEVVDIAARFLRGSHTEVESVEPVQTVVQRYTPEQRETLKKEASPMMGFSEKENEIVIHPGIPKEDYNFKNSFYKESYSQPHLRWRYGFDSRHSLSKIPRMDVPFSEKNIDVLQALTDDDSMRYRRFGWPMQELISKGSPESTEELIERQNLFSALEDLDINFEKIRRRFWRHFNAVKHQIPGANDMREKREGIEFENFFKSILQRVRDEAISNYGCPTQMLVDLTEALPNILEIDYSDLSKSIEKLKGYEQLNAFRMQKNPFDGHDWEDEDERAKFMEWKREHEQQEAEFLKSFQGEFGIDIYGGESLKQILQDIIDLLPNHQLKDLDYETMQSALLPVINNFQLVLDISDSGDRAYRPDLTSKVWQVLDALFREEYGHEGMVEALKETDSVHLHQWSNYMEKTLDHIFVNMKKGRALFDALTAFNDSESRFSCAREMQPEYYSDMLDHEFINMDRLRGVALWMKQEGFCDVEFVETNDVEIKGGWNLLYEDSRPHNKKNKLHPTKSNNQMMQIKNDSSFSGESRINLITGSNMSGKTFGMKKDIAAITTALITGKAPAKSMKMPVFDGVVYIDRVHTKEKEELSAFGHDCITWQKVLERVDQGENLFIAVDEAFSTVSPRYQASLSYGVAQHLASKGSTLALSSHNHDFVDAFLTKNPNFAKAWNFKTIIEEDGSVNFAYQKQPGHAPSNAIAVARHLGMNEGVLETAESL